MHRALEVVQTWTWRSTRSFVALDPTVAPLSLGAPLSLFALSSIAGVSLLSNGTWTTLRSRLTRDSGGAREALLALQSTKSIKSRWSWGSIPSVETRWTRRPG